MLGATSPLRPSKLTLITMKSGRVTLMPAFMLVVFSNLLTFYRLSRIFAVSTPLGRRRPIPPLDRGCTPVHERPAAVLAELGKQNANPRGGEPKARTTR